MKEENEMVLSIKMKKKNPIFVKFMCTEFYLSFGTVWCAGLALQNKSEILLLYLNLICCRFRWYFRVCGQHDSDCRFTKTLGGDWKQGFHWNNWQMLFVGWFALCTYFSSLSTLTYSRKKEKTVIFTVNSTSRQHTRMQTLIRINWLTCFMNPIYTNIPQTPYRLRAKINLAITKSHGNHIKQKKKSHRSLTLTRQQLRNV